MEGLSDFLSIWGALLSTILGVWKFIEFRISRKRALVIKAKVFEPFNQIEIELANKGTRPLTIVEFSLVYGYTPNASQLILADKFNEPIRLQDSDLRFLSIERKEILNQKGIRKIKQMRNQRLWVKIGLSTGQLISSYVLIDHSIIEGKYYQLAGDYISTDLFLEFPQLMAKVYPVGINK